MPPLVRQLKGDITEETVYLIWKENIVGTLTKYQNDALEEEYVFRIDWDAWDRLQPDCDICGLDMDLRLKEYVRPFVPTFMTDFMPPYGREDLQQHMDRVGMKGPYDMWDFMCMCYRNCRDNIRVMRVEEYTSEHYAEMAKKRRL